MSHYTLSPRPIPLEDGWDVIVAGGGPSGCTAAAAAAREGARTLLIEAVGTLGGMGTAGLVPAWCPFSDGEKIIYRGLAERVFEACKAGMAHVRKDALNWVPIDPERLKRIYDDLMTEFGVTVRFNTMLAGVEAEDGVVRALLVANKAGLTALRAKVYVDCTGDGDLSAWAGASYETGDAAGEVQPSTHCFMLSNVDTYAYLNGGRPRKHNLGPVVDHAKYPLLKDLHLCNNLLGPGTVGFNTGHLWDVDNTDPDSLSAAHMLGRRIAAQYRDAFAEYLPAAFANAFLAATGTLMGIRESRRIIGDYVLTIEDYLARRSFPDDICRNSYPVDIHTARGEIAAAARGEIHAMARYESYGKGESHGIPYRCLTPKGLRNVLVAGRCISTDRPVQASTRVMPVCLAMGEAAGVAAAQALADADVHAVDTARLRQRLLERGSYLP